MLLEGVKVLLPLRGQVPEITRSHYRTRTVPAPVQEMGSELQSEKILIDNFFLQGR